MSSTDSPQHARGSSRRLFLILTPLVAFPWSCLPVSAEEFNYDESKVPAYTLPELLKAEDGTKIDTAELWNTRRRPELLRLFEDHVFGTSPAGPAVNHPVTTDTAYHVRSGKHDVTDYDWEQYLNFADKHLMKTASR